MPSGILINSFSCLLDLDSILSAETFLSHCMQRVLTDHFSNDAVYMETGGTGTAGTFAINLGTATSTRTYKIKVTYVECSNPGK